MLQPRVVGILYGRLETLGLQPSTTASYAEETAPRHLPSHLRAIACTRVSLSRCLRSSTAVARLDAAPVQGGRDAA